MDRRSDTLYWVLVALAVSTAFAGVLLWVLLSTAMGMRPNVAAAGAPTDLRQPLRVLPQAPEASDQIWDAYVFRFDPVLESFETFTVPTVGANPHSLAVFSSPPVVEVWFTEPGADQIGRLVYTPSEYTFEEYPVDAGSRPLNLTLDEEGARVWFTEQAANRIGSLEIGGGDVVTYTTYDVPTPNSRPSGIALAGDGSVWFTEMAADKVGRLVVATSLDYSVTEFPLTGTGTDVGVYGISAEADGYVWVTETKTGIVRRMRMSDGGSIWVTGLGADGYPYDVAVDLGRDYVWLTERNDSQISQIQLTTVFLTNSFDISPASNFLPTGLTMLGNDQFWFAGLGTSQIGRLDYVSTKEFSFAVFDLPLDQLWSLDIASDGAGRLWTVAYSPHRLSMPVMMKSH